VTASRYIRRRRAVPEPGRDPVIMLVDGIRRIGGRVFPRRHRARVLIGAFAAVLAVACLTPLAVMLLGALKLTGTLFVPIYSLAVMTPPEPPRALPGLASADEGLLLSRADERVIFEAGSSGWPVVLTRAENATGDWHLSGIYDLKKTSRLEIFLAAPGDASAESPPLQLGFTDAAGHEFWLEGGPWRRVPAEAPGFAIWRLDVQRVEFQGALDLHDVRTIRIRPLAPRMAFGPIRLQLRQFGWDNYADILSGGSFQRYIVNSVVVGASVTLGNCIFCCLVGYAFARHRFRGRRLLWWTVLLSLAIPTQTMLVPIFLLMQHIPLAGGNDWTGQGGSGWLDTYWVLIVPWMVGPFGVFVMRQFLQSLPTDLEESAEMEGASTFAILRHVVFPLARPAVAVIGITTFMSSWNNFLIPNLVTRSDELRTLPVGLALYQGQHITDWGHLMAGAAIAALPVIFVFLVFQRFIIAGLTTGALKQ